MKTIDDFKTKYPKLSKFITSVDIDGRLCLLPYKQFCFEYKILYDDDKPGFLENLSTAITSDKVSHIYLAKEWEEYDIGEFIENKSVEFMNSFSKKDQLRFIINVEKKFEAILNGDLPITTKIINLSELKRRFTLYSNIKNIKDNRIYREIELQIQHLKEIEPYSTTEKPTNDTGQEFVNYSDNSKAERVVFMKELGILDFLRARMEDELVYFCPNKLAEVVSSFTGMEQSTLQSYLNPMFSKNVSNKNDPTKANKEKVRKKLINMGFKSQ